MSLSRRTAPVALLVGLVVAGRAVADPHPDPATALQQARHLDALPPVAPHGRARLDRSGRSQTGDVSWFGPGFAYHKMADGRPMNPHADVAASKTLPIGSTAKVTDLENGRSSTVTIEDRGPYVDGRVVDVSTQVARELALKKHGVAPVVVKPITVPEPDGAVKLGAGAAEASPAEVARATATTRRLANTAGTRKAVE